MTTDREELPWDEFAVVDEALKNEVRL